MAEEFLIELRREFESKNREIVKIAELKRLE